MEGQLVYNLISLSHTAQALAIYDNALLLDRWPGFCNANCLRGIE